MLIAGAPRTLPRPENYAADFAPVLRQESRNIYDRLPVAEYRRCFVTESGLALKGTAMVPETLFPVSAPATAHLTRYAWYKRMSTRRVRLHESDVLLLHNHWSAGYYHWLAEVLLKVQFIEPSSFSVVLPESYPRFADESFALFPWRQILKVPAGMSVVAKRLTVVGNPPTSGHNAVHFKRLSDTLRGLSCAPERGTHRLFLRRPRTAMRFISNEDEVLAALGEYGFVGVDAATLTFTEQVRLFAGCQFLVAAHGAGLTNLIFMATGGSLLELYRELDAEIRWMNIEYWDLCAAAGIRYYYQFCRVTKRQGPRADDVELAVDVAKLRRNVETMLSR